jgi:RND family efflux transporter MFP subunit
LLTAACSSGSADNTAQAAPAGSGARQGAGAGGRSQSVVLSAGDVASVRTGPIEAGTPVTGTLNPIEQVQVRARLEGDLEGVYVREGERVSQGQMLARFEASQQESERRSAEADREAAKSDLATAQWNADQSAELFKAGAIAEQALRTTQQAAAASRARLAAAEARVRATSSNVGDTRVLAPTSGVIEKRLVENGEHLARGAEMFSLVRNDVLELAAAVPARVATDVRAGQTVHFNVDGQRMEGRVARVSPTVDPTSRAVTVYVQIPNANGAIKGNSFATGRIVSRLIPGAVLVPLAAVRQAADSTGTPYVYRIANDAIERAEIEVGIIDDSQGIAEVRSGLQPGDRVIVGNVGSLGKGMKVQIVGEQQQQGSGTRGQGPGRP